MLRTLLAHVRLMGYMITLLLTQGSQKKNSLFLFNVIYIKRSTISSTQLNTNHDRRPRTEKRGEFQLVSVSNYFLIQLFIILFQVVINHRHQQHRQHQRRHSQISLASHIVICSPSTFSHTRCCCCWPRGININRQAQGRLIRQTEWGSTRHYTQDRAAWTRREAGEKKYMDRSRKSNDD